MSNFKKEDFCKELNFKTKAGYTGILVERKLPQINSDVEHPLLDLAHNGWYCGYVITPEQIKINKEAAPVFITYAETLANYLDDKNAKGYVYGFDHMHGYDAEFPATQKQVIDEIEELAKFLKENENNACTNQP